MAKTPTPEGNPSLPLAALLRVASNDNEDYEDLSELRAGEYLAVRFVEAVRSAPSPALRAEAMLHQAQQLVVDYPDHGRLSWLVFECFAALDAAATSQPDKG